MGIGAARADFENFVTCDRATVSTALVGGVLTDFPAGAVVRYRDADDPTRGVMRVEPQATNLLAWADIAAGFGQSGGWALEGATTQVAAGLGGGLGGLRIGSDGTVDARVRVTSAISVTSGQTYTMSIYYSGGTSGRVRMQAASGTVSVITDGPVGAVGSVFSRDVTDVSIVNRDHGAGVWSAAIRFTATVAATLEVAIGPASETVGEDVIALAAQVEEGTAASSLIVSAGTMATRVADVVTTPSPVSSGPFSIIVDFRLLAPQPAATTKRVFEIFSDVARAFLQVNGTAGDLRMAIEGADQSFAAGMPEYWVR